MNTHDIDISALQSEFMLQSWSRQNGYAPLSLDYADGCYLHTTDGRQIFDLRSAHECINLGFRHPRILQAMKNQMEKVVYVTDDFATEPTAFLAKKLAQLAPGSDRKKVWFGQSGASAVEAALKAARMVRLKETAGQSGVFGGPPTKIISRYLSWHGASAGAASVSGDPRRWFSEPATVSGVVFAPEANCYRCPLNQTFPECNLACADYIDHMIEMEGGSEKVAAVIMEPVVGSNGIIPPPENYFKRIREICDRWQVLLIIDETMTGFGRTGTVFAIEQFDIEPDIIVVGKALGMYSPLSAIIVNERVARVFDDQVFGHGQSYSGHALSAAAALEGLNILTEPGFLEGVVEKGRYLADRLTQLKRVHSYVGDVRGLGLFYTIEIVSNPVTKKRVRLATEKYTPTLISRMADYLLKEKNIYVPSDKFGLWVVPPLIVTYEELDWIVDALSDTLAMAETFISEEPKV